MAATKKPKCRTCGGYCGRRKGQGCQYAANEAKRRADELYQYATAGMHGKKGGAA
ncbi:hypothetical protein [Pseudogulbenkiania ferrooxidans]|uniref:Uncharacterized protein n=1 Tax=Pseudogulbenkiania ferrooxidans 2002 TaxID=279714 RepID=B9YYR3_9NEIS|nr:hypothetical protein [Pseudogulbenkiania ferrooxidans]EEG10266.1 hypothetical protein FuraDRAFT_0248 [Pseudogulbenkiania ferrooxidans 2002]